VSSQSILASAPVFIHHPLETMPIDACIEKVDIFLSARDLAQTQMLSKTDAFAVLFKKNGQTGQLERVGTTPVIKDTASPDWSKGFSMNYMFEVAQQVRIICCPWCEPATCLLTNLNNGHSQITIQIYQWSDGKPLENLAQHTLLGETVFMLANLITAPHQKLSPSLVNGKNKWVPFDSLGTKVLKLHADTLLLNFSTFST
jgi:hypothetical protein